MGYALGIQIVSGINLFCRIVEIGLLAFCVLSFFGQGTRAFQFLYRFFEPLLRPFRPISMWLAQKGFPFDVSVICAFFAISIIRSLLTQLVYMFMGIW